nr:uncharacterized protein LOC117277573 isoform X2 [Nicotiana tomentosiformis]
MVILCTLRYCMDLLQVRFMKISLAGPGAGISASADGIHAGISAGTDVVMQGRSYAGGHGGSQVNSTTGQMGSHAGQLYGSRGDAAVYDRLPSHSYAYRPSSYLECSGSMGLPNTILGDAYRPPPYMESSVGLPSTITGDAFRPPPYFGGSTGLPNTIPPPYQFADTVPAT